MTTSTSRKLTDFKYAATLIGAMAVVVSAAAVANAAPREWDIGAYDFCVEVWLGEYQTGDFTFQDYNDAVRGCCVNTGGDWVGDQCVAPPAEEAERQPAPTDFGGPSMTLWMPPPPVSPVGSPAGEATFAG